MAQNEFEWTSGEVGSEKIISKTVIGRTGDKVHLGQYVLAIILVLGWTEGIKYVLRNSDILSGLNSVNSGDLKSVENIIRVIQLSTVYYLFEIMRSLKNR